MNVDSDVKIRNMIRSLEKLRLHSKIDSYFIRGNADSEKYNVVINAYSEDYKDIQKIIKENNSYRDLIFIDGFI